MKGSTKKYVDKKCLLGSTKYVLIKKCCQYIYIYIYIYKGGAHSVMVTIREN